MKTLTMEKLLAQLTEQHKGWVLVSLATEPTTTRGGQAVIITIASPDTTGDQVTQQKVIRISNVVVGDISVGG